jgi:hypothetical protein
MDLLRTVLDFLLIIFGSVGALNFFEKGKGPTWLKELWLKIENSKLNTLPTTIINFCNNSILPLVRLVYKMVSYKLLLPISILLYAGMDIIYYQLSVVKFNYINLVALIMLRLILATYFFWVLQSRVKIFPNDLNNSDVRKLFIIIIFTPYRLIPIYTDNTMAIENTILISLLASPFIVYYISLFFFIPGAFRKITKSPRYMRFSVFIAVVIVISINITTIAMYIGHLFNEKSIIPRTFQIYFVNLCCDFLSVGLTFKIFNWAVKKDGLIKLPLAFIGVIFISVVLAIASIYLGLLFTENQLSIFEIIFMYKMNSELFGSSLFFLMNSVFIPILLIILILILAYLGKLFLFFIRKLLARYVKDIKAINLTLGYLLFIIVIVRCFIFAAEKFQNILY